MWAQKRKSVLSSVIFCFLIIFYPSFSKGSDAVPGPSILSFAAFEAVNRFGDQSTTHFLTTFYDVTGAPTVYLFLVTKNQTSMPEDIDGSIEEGRNLREEGESLIESGQTEEGERLITRSKNLLHQKDRFGTLLVSAKPEGPSLIAFHHGLPTYLIAKTEAKERAAVLFNGKHLTSMGVLYSSPLEYYFEFDVEGERILASLFDSEIVSRADLEMNLKSSDVPVSEGSGEDSSNHLQRNIDDLQDEDVAGKDLAGQSSDSQIIPGVPDYNQRPSIANSCGPTAGACLLGYWDAQGYEDYVQGVGTYDDVTLLIEELCQAMGWDPSFGVYYSQIPTGLRYIIDDRGYEFGIINLYGIDSLDIVRQEIRAGRPFIYGSQQNPWETAHFAVVVGYDGSFIIVHDNWWSTPVDYYVHWDALRHSDDMMTTLVPPGQSGPSSEPLPSNVGGSGGGCFISAVSQRQKASDPSAASGN